MTDFFRPNNLHEALEILKEYGERAAIVNGGSDIVISISQKKIAPDIIVYIGNLPELRYIREEKGVISLGGNVTYREMSHDPICQKAAGLMKAIANLGSPGVRAVATPAGNIGTAAPAADCATMLMALGADVVLANSKRERTVSLEDFYAGRNCTVKQADEIIREIRFSAIRQREGTGYCKVARRKAQDIGKVLAGVRVHLEKNIVREAAISLGALNAEIVRAVSLEEAIRGMKKETAYQYLKENFPAEAGLRESYFKEYKESVTKSIIAQAFSCALADAEKGRF